MIGQGQTRTVYELASDPTNYVVKVEPGKYSFNNAAEWKNWNDYQNTHAVQKWLAPCKAISPCGLLLIQRRAKPLHTSEQPARLPRFLTDLKAQNYGWIDGLIVCVDYAHIIVNANEKLRKVEWFQ